jgi:hypothetical protein
MRFSVNALATSLRSRVCSGGSMAIMASASVASTPYT